MNKYKPGYKTSEFWFTLVSFIFSGLYLTGILSENEQKEELITIVSHAVESCILIGGQAFVFYKYISARQAVKQIDQPVEHTENSKTTEEQQEIHDESITNNTNRNRKNNKRNKSSSTKRKRSSTKRGVENSTTSRSSSSKSNRKPRSESNKPRKKTDSSGND